MKKSSIRKWSVLGLVLMGASAVTAAVLPSNDIKDADDVNNGTLVNAAANTTDGWTCIARDGSPVSCTLGDSGGATTAVNSSLTEVNAQRDTKDNTSNDAAIPAYGTSLTQAN